MLFPFVRFEFTSSLGPPEGRYPLAPVESDGTEGNDALLVAVVGAPPPQRLLRRTRPADSGDPVRELSLLRITWVETTAAVKDAGEGRRLVAELRAERRREPLIEHALATVNLAIRAYAVTVMDPFAREVSRHDPREVHIGVGTGEQLDQGRWTNAFHCPPPARGRARVSERLRPDMAVAEVLSRRTVTLDGELHLLRTLLDVDQERPESAARELEAAAELLPAQLPLIADEFAQRALEPPLARAAEIATSSPSAGELRTAARDLLEAVGRAREATWAQRER